MVLFTVLRRLLFTALFIITGFVSINADARQSIEAKGVEVNIEPHGLWVNKQSLDLTKAVPSEDISNGVYYRLVGAQTQVTKDKQINRYRRFVQQAVNPTGVESVSQVSIVFDTHYQSLVLHQLTIWRDGKAIDKSASAKMSILQQEKELDEFIYNGDHTLSIIVDDVRIGDVLDYSYTISGANPVFSGSFSLYHSTSWGVPVGQVHRRVLWQSDKPLYHQINNSEQTIVVTNTDGGSDYVYNQYDVPRVHGESDTPSWFTPYGEIYFSDVKHWQQVVEWGTPLFDNGMQVNDDILAIVNDIRSQSSDKGKQAALALQYVQEKIRYMGIEFGVNSHQPSFAGETLARHYGDCKDKVVLLNTILKALGIVAHPALVDSDYLHTLKEQLPRYAAFDHVITYLEVGGKSYWFDPTRAKQAGDIDDIHQPNYGYALLLDGQSTELTEVVIEQAPSSTQIFETFELFKTPNMDVNYGINTVYKRRQADRNRSKRANSGVTRLSEDYLSFYQDYYPNIQVVDALYTEDDTDNNIFKIFESYKITDAWKADMEDQDYNFSFYANAVGPSVSMPDDVKRQYPLAVSHRQDIEQQITIKFPDDDWGFKDGTTTISNEFFDFTEKVTFEPSKRQLVLYYSLSTKTGVIYPEQLAAYRKAVQGIKDNDSFGIRKNMLGVKEEVEEEATDWELVIFAVYFALTIIAFAWYKFGHEAILPKEQVSHQFYPIGAAKFVIYNVLTVGFYAIFWMYRQWCWVKQRDDSLIMPFWRAIFLPLWVVPLYRQLAAHRQAIIDDNAQGEKSQTAPKLISEWLAWLITGLVLFIGTLSFEYTVASWLEGIIVGTVLLPWVIYINRIEGNHQALIRHSSYIASTPAVILASVLLVVFPLLQHAKRVPAYYAYEGSQIPAHDLRYMLRKNVLEDNDKVKWFYSDGFLSNREDGNGFTQRHVFSYWWEDGQVQVATAQYNNIANIKVSYGVETLDQTIITITRDSGSEFKLFVATDYEKDKVFVEQLQAQWKKLNPEAYQIAQQQKEQQQKEQEQQDENEQQQDEKIEQKQQE